MKKEIIYSHLARFLAIAFTLQFIFSALWAFSTVGYAGGIYGSVLFFVWIYTPAFYGLYALNLKNIKAPLPKEQSIPYLFGHVAMAAFYFMVYISTLNPADRIVSMSLGFLVFPIVFFAVYALYLRRYKALKTKTAA